jgi:hypothetical protein
MFTGVRPLRNFPQKNEPLSQSLVQFSFQPPPIEHVLPVGHQRVFYNVLYLYEEEEEDEDE